MTWRTVSVVLAAACAFQLWRDCTRDAPPPAVVTVTECAKLPRVRFDRTARFDDRQTDTADEAEPPPPPPASDGVEVYGFKVPSWAAWLAPHPGENLRAYRDRMLPLAQTVIAPHRARVARSRDDMAANLGLDTRQRGELDAAAQAAANAIEERVLAAIMNEELSPATFKPMVGIGMARDLLDVVDRENHRFVDSLHDDQRAKLAQHPFDFADYLVFSTKWEDMLKLLN